MDRAMKRMQSILSLNVQKNKNFSKKKQRRWKNHERSRGMRRETDEEAEKYEVGRGGTGRQTATSRKRCPYNRKVLKSN